MTTKTLTYIFIGGILAMLLMRGILSSRSPSQQLQQDTEGTTEEKGLFMGDEAVPENFEQQGRVLEEEELPEVSEDSTDAELLDALSTLDAEFGAATPGSNDLSEIE